LLRGRGQSHSPDDTWIEPSRNGLDGAALACGIASLEDDGDPQALVDNPALELGQLGLELGEFPLVPLSLEASSPS
jgi:hypothetical protein